MSFATVRSNLRRLPLLLLLLLLGALPAKGQSVTGAEVICGSNPACTINGANISIAPPNTPASQFASPSGTNTFIIPLANASASIRVWITNNTANPCTNFTAQVWAASDATTNSFNLNLSNWQVIPIQSTAGTLLNAAAPSIPASAALYFTTAVISSPRVALQLVNTSPCAGTNIEVTAVVTPVAVTSPLVSAFSNTNFNGNSSEVQGLVAAGQSGSVINPLVNGGVQLPTNQTFLSVGIDGVNSSAVSITAGSSGTFTIGTVPGPTQSNELAIAFDSNQSDFGTTSVLAPFVLVPGQSVGQWNVSTTSNPQLGQQYRRSYQNSTPGGTELLSLILVQTPNVTLRTASFNSSSGGNPTNLAYSANTLAGSLLIAAFQCSANTTQCTVGSVADTQSHTWLRATVVGTGSTSSNMPGQEVWIATTTSTAAADTVTPTMSVGTIRSMAVVEVPSVLPASVNEPAVASQFDATGANVMRLDAQQPNFLDCTLTISTNTTTQLTNCGAPTTIGVVPVRIYITDILIQTTAVGTATTLQFKAGTGTNCGTGTVNLSPITFADTAVGLQTFDGFRVPFFTPSTQQAVCVTQAGTTAGTAVVEVHGFLAP